MAAARACLALAPRPSQLAIRIREQGAFCKRNCDNIFPTSSTYRPTLRYYCDRPSGLPSSQSSPALPELTLYTKTPCPLCDEALEALAPALHRVSLRKVDITLPENSRWHKLYRYDIPVFHFNNTFLMKHRGDLAVLLRALETFETSKA